MRRSESVCRLVWPLAGPPRQSSDWAVLVEAESDTSRSLLTRRMTTFRKLEDL